MDGTSTVCGRPRARRAGRRARTGALLSALAAAALLAGCTVTGPDGDDGRGRSDGGRDGRTSAPPVGSVLAVKIDNVSAARPQTGLDAADIVYAEQVEGGLSRLMAVYATTFPESVGPVRSARESDLELLRQFDEPTLAFSGAQGKLLPLIDRAPLHAETPGDAEGAYFRGDEKPVPHNLYLRPKELIDSPPGAEALTTGFRYGPLPDGGTPEDSRTVRYPAARFTFAWSQESRRWEVSMDGTRAVTTDGTRVAPATVVIQHVTIRESRFHDYLGNNTPYTQTVGSGRAEVLRDGRVFDTRWERRTPADGTAFTTADGEPMTFARGQVWVVYAKA
ncbi:MULTISPECIES: DUF3048 domain-containing protein [Streptomyces]|uniref:DUF3048 domain-containing protein n=1 Tax=Streptomyces TaxID=1883 RepID=UPI000BCE5064|nr:MULTISPECIES: DUF3048 domain-containing protein [Streptomyces]MDX2555294.1 DUF3048 domain-containing protein [Streptomyces stelliscabiei]MDX2612983.1 DUF3048 domain-containing protein [Streptomyces stelliscabiei]MDX2637458.1 DUF3048 domain-containing protein [Streptomyces stelliscabiei]MDX2663344.1 DUF3048 domain-containing protein [Streptomyces stelliscabiei]MDX2711974.1 DUF3048 domain-containing protein [Streptomyces stelliscabiei]